MAEKYGKCTNLGNCSAADEGKVLTIPGGEEFQCPECKGGLIEVPGGGGTGRKGGKGILLAAAAAGIVAIIGVIVYLLLSGNGGPAGGGTAGGGSQGGGSQGGGAGGGSVTAEKVIERLESGDFRAARRMLKDASGRGIDEIRENLEQPVTLDVEFETDPAGGADGGRVSVASSRLSALILNHRDGYRFHIDNRTPDREIYLYIFQHDEKGSVDQVFPNPKFGTAGNPLDDEEMLQVPSGGDWFSLDELPEDADGTTLETVTIVASPWKAADLEALFDEAGEEGVRFGDLQARLGDREGLDIPGLYYAEFSFMHGR